MYLPYRVLLASAFCSTSGSKLLLTSFLFFKHNQFNMLTFHKTLIFKNLVDFLRLHHYCRFLYNPPPHTHKGERVHVCFWTLLMFFTQGKIFKIEVIFVWQQTSLLFSRSSLLIENSSFIVIRYWVHNKQHRRAGRNIQPTN